MFVMMLAAGAQASVILTNDNFDGYNDMDDYITVNTWGWTAFSTSPHPYVRASHNVSAPHGLSDDEFQNFAMQKVLGSPITGGDVTLSFYARYRNAYWSPIQIQMGQNGAQDRVYFLAGGNNSWTYKYMGLNGAWTDILDTGGVNPLEVSHGSAEAFERVDLTLTWNGTDYDSTYEVQIFDINGNPRSQLTTCQILDQDFRDNGIIEDFDWILFNAPGSNHPRWVDNLYLEAIPEPATISLVALALLAIRRKK